MALHRGHSIAYRRSLATYRDRRGPALRHAYAVVYAGDRGWYAEYPDGSRQGPYVSEGAAVGIARLYTADVQVRQ